MRRALAGAEQVFERDIIDVQGVHRNTLAKYIPDFADGAVVGFFVEVTDVTRVKLAESALRRQVELLKKEARRITPGWSGPVERKRAVIDRVQDAAVREVEADTARQGAFLAQLAHELRNFLAPMNAGAVLLNQSVKGSEPVVAKICTMMSRQVSHMSRLVDDLLDFASVEAGVLPMIPHRIDLGDAIREASVVSETVLTNVRHSLTLRGTDRPLFIEADPTRMVQVFANLLTNAAKYTPPGGRIEVSVSVEGGLVSIAVKDNGVGMAASELAWVFGLFSQSLGSAALRQGGLGIGLALVRQIVRAHGGSVVASSAGLGMGSTFTVTLPLAVVGGSAPPLNDPRCV